jgi:multiple sugar transport system substrate-binding protein
VLFDHAACQGDSHTFVIPRSERRTPEQLQRAMLYIKSLLDQSLTWAKGGHIPAYLPTLNSPEYARLKPQSDYASAVDSVVYDAQAWYSGSGSNFENTLGSQLGLVQQGTVSPKDALATARAQLETYARTESPL